MNGHVFSKTYWEPRDKEINEYILRTEYFNNEDYMYLYNEETTYHLNKSKIVDYPFVNIFDPIKTDEEYIKEYKTRVGYYDGYEIIKKWRDFDFATLIFKKMRAIDKEQLIALQYSENFPDVKHEYDGYYLY